jgi:CrcB protein
MACSFSDFLIVGAGGAAGAMLRFGVQNLPLFATDKYYLTAVVNIVGCLLIGVFWAVAIDLDMPRWFNRLAIVGLLGGFTTYSSFAYDTFALLQQGRWSSTAIYLAITIVGGLLATAAGFLATQRIISISRA